MKKLLLFFTILFYSLASLAQTKPEELMKSFFETYPKNSRKAIDDLYATNLTPSKTDIDNIKKKINYDVLHAGKYFGYEIITMKQFSESLVLYSYLIKYERKPLRFVFKFYKPNDRWMILEYKIDDELSNELEHSARLQNLSIEQIK